MKNGTPTVVYPEPLIEKCLRLEAPGGELDRVMIAIPAVVRTGKPFGATVGALDANAMPVLPSGPVEMMLKGGDGHDVAITLGPGRSAVCRVEGLVRNGEGLFRLEAEAGDDVFVSNPSLASDEDRPLVLWGDPHIHTTVGDCHPDRCRTRNLAYAAMRHAYGLDFIAIADHVSWNCRGTKGKWRDNLACCELFNEPGVFSALYCYETSMRGGRGGDCNVYLRAPVDGYVDPWPDDLNVKTLSEKVAAEHFVVPHHTTRTGKHGEIPPEIYPDERSMPVVEIHSKWGTSEYRGNPTPLLKVHPGPSYVQDLLAQGYRFGFIGGTDTHTSLTFCRMLEGEAHRAMPGLTAVFATANRRTDIYDAIKDRRCYAACGERILLEVSCAGFEMGRAGSLPESGEVDIEVTCAAETDIEAVEVVRNNEVVHRAEPGDWNATLEWTDADAKGARPVRDFVSGASTVFYYVRVTAKSGARAWSSPCFFDFKEEQ